MSKAAEYELDGDSFTLQVARVHMSLGIAYQRHNRDLRRLSTSSPTHIFDPNLSLLPFTEDTSEEERTVGIILRLGKSNFSNEFHGYIALHQPDTDCSGGLRRLSSREIEPNKIDWSVVRQWLQDCDDEHDCETDRAKRNLLPHFKVIDTTRREIVFTPKGCRYVALSYVWGTNAMDSESFVGSSLPDPAPLTIEDAITCTKALGFRFLWVDRYCIDQEAHETKHTMVQNMDKIYMDATLTLIDATGSSSTGGLAGVSLTQRIPPKWVKVHGECLSVVPNVVPAVHNSTWDSRGWTYQEGALSRRRLVFTHSQVYFQCLEMHCCESLAAELKSNSPWSKNLATSLQVFPSRGQDPTGVTAFNDRLKEYLRRNLTYESDILNAFSGILRQFWYAPDPTYHFWGLRFNLGKFLIALLWLPWCEDSRQRVSRRQSFPSWSWAGWKGITGVIETSGVWPEDSLNVSVSVEDSSGRQFDIKSYIESMSGVWNIYRFKPVIQLTGWVTDVRLRPESDVADEDTIPCDMIRATDDTLVGGGFVLQPYLPIASHLDTDPLLNLTWPLFFFVRDDGKLKGVVLKKVDGRRYERAGVLHLAWFKPMIVIDDETARLRKLEWTESVWLDCRRQVVELV